MEIIKRCWTVSNSVPYSSLLELPLPSSIGALKMEILIELLSSMPSSGATVLWGSLDLAPSQSLHVSWSAVTGNIACWKPPALQLKSLHIIHVVPCYNHVVPATSSKQDGPGYFLWICYSTFLVNSVLMQGLGLCLRCSRASALRIWKIMPKCWMKTAAQLKWRHSK